MEENNEYLDFLPEFQQQVDRRSGFTIAKEKAKNGAIVNGCRAKGFGCEDPELWPNGLCRHVVGITLAGDDTTYCPLKRRPGGGPVGTEPFMFIDGNDLLPVQPDDKLMKISVTSRVYRDTDKFPVEGLTDLRPRKVTPKKPRIVEPEVKPEDHAEFLAPMKSKQPAMA